MKLIIRIFLLCSIIFIGCIKDNQFVTTNLNQIVENIISYTVFYTDKKICDVGILSCGNIIIKHDVKIDVENIIYKCYYSLLNNEEILSSFNLENEKYIPYLYDSDSTFLLTNDDRIVISVPFPGGKRGRGTRVPAVFNLETYELEEIHNKSWFMAVGQNKSPNSEIVSIGFNPRIYWKNTNPFTIGIRVLKDDGKYNIKRRNIKIFREDINRLADVYPGNKGNEIILLYNNEETAIIEVYDYKKRKILHRYILPKKVSEMHNTAFKSSITLSPDGKKMVIFNNMNSLLFIFLETNEYIEIEIDERRLQYNHDWAWDSTSVVFVSEKNDLYHFYFNE